MQFPDFGLAEAILRAISTSGYSTPTPIQAQAIPHVLAERDVLGCAQTGTGKTAAFALPVLHRLNAKRNDTRGRKPRALVLSPTRELASQIAHSFEQYGRHTSLRQTTVFGGVNQFHQVQALSKGIDILVATPGRLLDLMEQGHVDLRHIEILVIDEADRMFDMGFLPDLRRIISRVPTARQTLLFSATMLPEVEQLASAVLRNPVQIRIAPSTETTALIEQSVVLVPQGAKLELLAHFLGHESVSRAVVFTRTKHGADRVVRKLGSRDITAAAIHGNKSQNARENALAAFKSQRVQVLVATDVAARGIDIDGVTHVFNYDLPEDPKTYVHRIGRTGRAGAKGIAISFCDVEERRYLRDIEKALRQSLSLHQDVPSELLKPVAPTTNPPEQRPTSHARSSASARPQRSPRANSPIAAPPPGNGRPSKRKRFASRTGPTSVGPSAFGSSNVASNRRPASGRKPRRKSSSGRRGLART